MRALGALYPNTSPMSALGRASRSTSHGPGVLPSLYAQAIEPSVLVPATAPVTITLPIEAERQTRRPHSASYAQVC